MLRHGRLALRSLARDSWKVAIGAAVGVLAGGAIVWGDGGDPSLVHACIMTGSGSPSDPNVRIIGENETCTSGTPKHWSIQGPQGPAGAVTPEAFADASKIPGLKPPGVKPSSTLLKKLKFKPSQTKTVKGVKGPNGNPIKQVDVFCPLSHPKIATGGLVLDPGLGQQPYGVVQNSPLGTKGWRAAVIKGGAFTPWKLTASATCHK